MYARHLAAVLLAAGVVAAVTATSVTRADDDDDRSWSRSGSYSSTTGGYYPTQPAPTPTPTVSTQALAAAQCVGCHGAAAGCTCKTASCTDPVQDVCQGISSRHHALIRPRGFTCTTCHMTTPTATTPQGVVLNLDCPSCHGGDPHATAHAAKFFPSWFGLPGVNAPAAPFWTAPARAGYTPVAQATEQYQVCFGCHSSYGFVGSGINGPSGLPLTDVAKEYNPANLAISGSGGIGGGGDDGGSRYSGGSPTLAGGAHPVVTSVANDLGHTNNILAPWGVASTMLCTDCHQAQVSGSTATIGLKGPKTQWDATLTLGSRNQSNAFCFNCHSSSFRSSKFPGHTEDDHYGMQCFACHAAIPHGGPRPGMIVATAGASAAVGGVIPGWDQSAPYSMMGSGTPVRSGEDDEGFGARFYIKSYPPAGRGWDKGNCGCNGTKHD